jgi:hypothetical protein
MERKSVNIIRNDRFIVKSKEFDQQYSHIYTLRVGQMRPLLMYVNFLFN